MIRTARLLYATYGVNIAFLAYCAAQSFRNQAPWFACAFIASSGFLVIASIREGELEDALRREAVRAERDARLHPRPADDATAAVALAEACCDQWWTSAGQGHEPTCPHQQPRSNAA